MLDANGLAYEDLGDGEPVLLIHGAAIAVNFIRLTKEASLSETYRLIRYHRRGFYGSVLLAGEDKITGQDYARVQVQDALAVLENAGVSRTHVVGHSGGGWVAVQLATDAPEAVHSLVLAEPAIYAMKPSWSDAARKTTAGLYEIYEKDPNRAIDMFFSATEGERWRSFADTLPGGSEQWMVDTKATFFELVRVLDWTFGPPEAARISQPVLYITGGESPSFIENVKSLFTSWVPQTEGVVIPNEGHNMFLRRPAAAAREIAAFLRRHPMRH